MFLCAWENKFLVCNLSFLRWCVLRVVPVSGRYLTTWPRDKQSWHNPPSIVTSVRDSNTGPWHRPRTRRMHQLATPTRHTADTADQLVEFVLHFFVYVSFKIGEITHSTFFQIIFCLSLILDYQGAECVLSAIPFFPFIHPSIHPDYIWRHNATE